MSLRGEEKRLARNFGQLNIQLFQERIHFPHRFGITARLGMTAIPISLKTKGVSYLHSFRI
jgi:hypothetical protein